MIESNYGHETSIYGHETRISDQIQNITMTTTNEALSQKASPGFE
ncbi:MAG: hypothetical protein ACXAC7_14635 [Candidatus Hodarchaeales archaeon]